MDYMVYAYLQQGRDETALAVIKEIGGNTTGEYIAGALGSYNALAMPARYALERDDWKGRGLADGHLRSACSRRPSP